MNYESLDTPAWRALARADLLARRTALPAEDRRRMDARVTELLEFGFGALRGLVVGTYWPMKGEFDPRVAVKRLRDRGARAALPVVVQKAAPLQFREWWPGLETRPGVFGLPVPQGSPVVVPDALLIPPVGIDAMGYRLGYGGGYFDRTLAALSPQPLKVAVAREASRMDTIHPQPHDIPMDFVVTEAGVHEVTATGLRLVERLADVDRLVTRLLEQRRSMSQDEISELLNTLLEAERAGAMVINAFIGELPLPADARAELLRLQRDESGNCAVLLRLLRGMGAEPSKAVGSFFEKALAVRGVRPRLEFLNRGQAWVARRIAAALPRIQDAEVRNALRSMRDSHFANIRSCEDLLAGDLPPS